MQHNKHKTTQVLTRQFTTYQYITHTSNINLITLQRDYRLFIKKCYRISRISADVKATRRGARRNAPLRVRLRLRNRAFVH